MEKPIQSGGVARRWANPTDSEVWRFLTRLDESCEPTQYPGMLILTDRAHKRATMIQVKNLWRELGELRKRYPELEIGYWRVIANDEEGAEFMRQLTEKPLFDDRI